MKSRGSQCNETLLEQLYDRAKSSVFSLRRKTCSDGDARTDSGRLFQTDAAAAWKVLSPMVTNADVGLSNYSWYCHWVSGARTYARYKMCFWLIESVCNSFDAVSVPLPVISGTVLTYLHYGRQTFSVAGPTSCHAVMLPRHSSDSLVLPPSVTFIMRHSFLFILQVCFQTESNISCQKAITHRLRWRCLDTV